MGTHVEIISKQIHRFLLSRLNTFRNREIIDAYIQSNNIDTNVRMLPVLVNFRIYAKSSEHIVTFYEVSIYFHREKSSIISAISDYSLTPNFNAQYYWLFCLNPAKSINSKCYCFQGNN